MVFAVSLPRASVLDPTLTPQKRIPSSAAGVLTGPLDYPHPPPPLRSRPSRLDLLRYGGVGAGGRSGDSVGRSGWTCVCEAVLHDTASVSGAGLPEMSKLGRVEDDGTMGSTTTMDEIDKKIQSYGTLIADIKSVDAQESFNSGVIVLITGVMIKKDYSRQSFTQTFFLAPQDKGYFVLNDIFRYTEEEVDGKRDGPQVDGGKEDGIVENEKMKTASVEPASHEHEASPEEEENASGCMEEVNGGGLLNASEVVEDTVGDEEEEPVAEVIDEEPTDVPVVIESKIEVEEVPKKSYASIVKVMKPNTPSTSPPALPRTAVRMQEQVIVAPPPTSVPDSPFPSPEVIDDGYDNQVAEGDGCSVYLKNLPLNTTPSLVEETFKSFGAIKSGAIQVRSNKGFCFGFVEFKAPASAQSAIEASPIKIGGHQVGVEEKKSTSTRGGGRGRYPSGRGGAFRGEGARGRGNYSGGRGYWHGDTVKSDYSRGDSVKSDYSRGDSVKSEYSRGEYGRGSGRGYQSREGYQMANGFGRGSRGGGPAMNPAPRAQRVPASA
ncbi:Nuclear transport factor 2-like protein [Drosera capensis]